MMGRRLDGWDRRDRCDDVWTMDIRIPTWILAQGKAGMIIPSSSSSPSSSYPISSPFSRCGG